MTDQISTLFLILGLIFPRLTLFVCWLTGSIPANTTPFALDVIGALFLPRFLIAVWAYEAHVHIGWVVAYVVLGLAELLGGGGKVATTRSN